MSDTFISNEIMKNTCMYICTEDNVVKFSYVATLIYVQRMLHVLFPPYSLWAYVAHVILDPFLTCDEMIRESADKVRLVISGSTRWSHDIIAPGVVMYSMWHSNTHRPLLPWQHCNEFRLLTHDCTPHFP